MPHVPTPDETHPSTHFHHVYCALGSYDLGCADDPCDREYARVCERCAMEEATTPAEPPEEEALPHTDPFDLQAACAAQGYEANPTDAHQHICAGCGLRYGCTVRTPEHHGMPECPTCRDERARLQRLPEAPASLNCFVLVAGRRCQLTLRDHDETRVLLRLEAVLERYPVQPYEGR